jgi:hypothetical protein
VIVSAEDRARLAAIIGDRSRPLMHVQRARIGRVPPGGVGAVGK